MTDTSTLTQQEPHGLDPVLLSDIADAVDERDTRWLSRTLKRMHPADAADALESLPYDIFEEAIGLLGEDLPSEILIDGIPRNRFGLFTYIEPGTYEICSSAAAGSRARPRARPRFRKRPCGRTSATAT